MKKVILTSLPMMFIIALAFTKCSGTVTADTKTEHFANGGFESQEKWGEHLVTIGACHDCHTPKRMTDMGPILDSSLLLSGHQANQPKINLPNKGELQRNGLAVTGDLTEWIGPWGISYSANLTPDATGTGNWKEEQFFRALREGKYKGLADGRMLLPPMPWEMYRHMTDDEIKAVFAYLKTVKPIKNLVPPPLPPEAP